MTTMLAKMLCLRLVPLGVALAACAGRVPSSADTVSAPTARPSLDASLRRSIAARIDGARAHVPGRIGPVVVGVYAGGEATFFTSGTLIPDGAPVDTRSIFKVCSVTKVFTGVLLADGIERGRIALSDEAQAHLTQLKLPIHRDGPIRVEHLATYSAGFPWQPTNFMAKSEGGYTREAWRQFIEGFALPRRPGETYQYGNVGFALLGDVLAEDAGQPLDVVFRTRLFEPLQMYRSGFIGDHSADPNRAQGVDESGKPVPLDFDEPSQPAACAMETSGDDLMKFVRAHFEDGQLSRAMKLALVPRRKNDSGADVGLGWFVSRRDEYAWKTGAIEGYRSLIGVDVARRLGVVVLAGDERIDTELVFKTVLADLRRALVAPSPATIPRAATAVDVLFDEGLRLVAIDAPAAVTLGQKATVRYFYRVEKVPVHEWQVFVHADAPRERVGSDHVFSVPMRGLALGSIVEDRVELDFRATLENREVTLYNGFFYRSDRMDFSPASEDRRFRGPTIRLVGLETR